MLGNITLELGELRRTNDELTKDLVRLRSLETCSEVKTIKTSKVGAMPSEVVGELGDNHITSCNHLIHQRSYPQTPTVPLPSSPSLSSSCLTDRSEVVSNGELIITNYIDGEIDSYNKVAHAVLAALDPSDTISDILSARLLSIVTPTVEQMNKPSRIAVKLASSPVVNRVLQTKTKRTRFCTDDLDPTVLGGDLSTRVKKHCKIFVNEAHSKEKFKLFCNLKSAAKSLGIKYVWHRGGRFMARAQGGDRAHLFESLSELQAILHASRNNFTQSGERDASSIASASVSELPPSTTGVRGFVGEIFARISYAFGTAR